MSMSGDEVVALESQDIRAIHGVVASQGPVHHTRRIETDLATYCYQFVTVAQRNELAHPGNIGSG